MDEDQLEIGEIKISPDRKRVMFELPEMKELNVIYIRLNHEAVVSSADRNFWTTEAWYAMNNIPEKPKNL